MFGGCGPLLFAAGGRRCDPSASSVMGTGTGRSSVRSCTYGGACFCCVGKEDCTLMKG
jgi:hypothetical protein